MPLNQNTLRASPQFFLVHLVKTSINYSTNSSKTGCPTACDVNANEERMKMDWDPNERDIADVVCRINEASIFAHFINHTKPDKELTTKQELFSSTLASSQSNTPKGKNTKKLCMHGHTLNPSEWHKTAWAVAQAGHGSKVETILMAYAWAE